MSNEFGTWWPCLRKHYKRTKIWLPRIKAIATALGDARPLRYFTLCARPMIDVYMLVRENVLGYDDKTRRIHNVSFCECDPVIFPEITELIGVEESGFLEYLEKLVLFQDIPETETLDSSDALTLFVEETGENIPADIRNAVEKKRKYIQLQEAFPFDFLNLDFCARYYPEPPDVMAIHRTIEKILEWQRRPFTTSDGTDTSVSRFGVAITCRLDAGMSPDITNRLKTIVRANVRENVTYQTALADRDTADLARWAQDDPLDFFMSAWPKEIAKMAKLKAWDIEILDHVFYDRTSRSGKKYHMVCLVVEFVKTDTCTTYLQAVTKALDKEGRIEIARFDAPLDTDGKALMGDLRKIVKLRNKQASAFEREELPDPEVEIVRLRSEGVAI